ncbi:bifunctional DNA primase/polymerase [Terrihabitans sp. B22-R8]|uniref:bifunctional DNA primase/polymerase n=1 Tax=Terrihabitans sp. B22-R8 TaxID=3425128 RepID=UPI00403C934C
MSGNIFADNAPTFWDRDLRVIPLEPNSKRPAKGLKSWQAYLASPPSEKTRGQWLNLFADHGIGLLLGTEAVQGFLLSALDVDDDKLTAFFLKFLGLVGEAPTNVLSGKRGKKGITIFVRAPMAGGFKSQKLEGGDGLGDVDVLGSGRMTVMPPSVHPDTGMAYEAVGKAILEVSYDSLPVVTGHEMALIKVVIGSDYTAAIIGGKTTHEAGVGLSAQLVASGATDEEIRSLFEALLPDDYNGDTLEELPGWVASAREKGFGTERSDKKSLTAALVGLVTSSSAELFNDGDRTAFASVPMQEGIATYRVLSEDFALWLRHQAHVTLGKAVGAGPLTEALGTIEALALFEGATRRIDIRVAGDDQKIEIDLGTRDGRTVAITSDGWKVNPTSLHKFVRGAGFDVLPEPARGGSLRVLQTFLGLDDQNYNLLIAFLLNALKPTGPYFILLVEGEQGSGKSFFCEVIKRVIDPNKASRLRLPDNEKDLMIQAKDYRLLNFDNASGMRGDMSDVLCALATGSGIAVRKLYTNGDLHVMTYARPFVINGIAGYANRADLMERAIPIKLPPMQEGSRKTEAEMLAEFESILPGVLGALYDAVAAALRNYHQADFPRHIRMADSARFIHAADAAFDEPGAIINAITAAQHNFIVDRISDEPLVIKLRAITRHGTFTGYVADLFATFDLSDQGLPRSPSRLSNALDRMRPAMAKAGVYVEFMARDRRGRPLKIWSDPTEGGVPKF